MIDPISIVTNGFQSNIDINRNFMIAIGGYGFLMPTYSVHRGGSTSFANKHPLVNHLDELDTKEIKLNLYINDSKISQSLTKSSNKVSVTNISITETIKKISIKI
jgi:hypothetical protein